MSRLIPLELPPAGGHHHHVLLRLPDGKPAQGPLPLLCLLDGQWTLPLLEESGHPALQHCAILSLGYQGDRDQITR
ncbi:alpha/beta hydrolase, partial [Providencia rettgeri]|nr:alpha/beta hydrolase [Providencia rettgeri]